MESLSPDIRIWECFRCNIEVKTHIFLAILVTTANDPSKRHQFTTVRRDCFQLFWEVHRAPRKWSRDILKYIRDLILYIYNITSLLLPTKQLYTNINNDTNDFSCIYSYIFSICYLQANHLFEDRQCRPTRAQRNVR